MMIDAYSISMMIAPTVTSSLTATYATQSQLLTCTVRMYLQIIDDECVRPTNYLEATPRVNKFHCSRPWCSHIKLLIGVKCPK